MAFNRVLGIALGAAVLCSSTSLHLAHAKPFMIVGNDEKVWWDDDGKVVLSPSGKDTVLIVDLADPESPKIVATLPLKNSIVGPPVNLDIDPSGSIALVADSVDVTKDGEALKQVPDNKVYVIDLKASPPKLAATVTVGKQPSGLSISPSGKMALVANRGDNSISVLSINGTDVKVTDTVATARQRRACRVHAGRQARAGRAVPGAQGLGARYRRRQGDLQQGRPADRPMALQRRGGAERQDRADIRQWRRRLVRRQRRHHQA